MNSIVAARRETAAFLEGVKLAALCRDAATSLGGMVVGYDSCAAATASGVLAVAAG